MKRLSLLVLGVFTTWLGVRIVSGAESFAPYLLRDALLPAVIGGSLFALQAGGWQAPPVFRRRRGLPRAGQIVLLTGLLVTLAAGAGFVWLADDRGSGGLAGVPLLTATIAWWLGILLQLAGAWWRGPAVDYARPQVRWARNAAGNIVPLQAGDPPGMPARRALDFALSRRTYWAWLLAVLTLAALLRFWNLQDLPPGCVGEECAAALRVAQAAPWEWGVPGSGGLLAAAAGAIARVTGDGLLSLRLAAAACGWLTVLAVAWALRRLAGGPAALLGTALLAISPWHLWAGRSSDPWLAAGLLAALTLWLGLEALARTHVRWWLPWGIAAGLLAAEAPALWGGVALWALVAGGIGFVHGWQRRRHAGEGDLWLWPLAGLAAAAGAALPAVMDALRGTLGTTQEPAITAGLPANLALLGNALLRQEAAAIGPFTATGLAGGITAALALCGVTALLRHWRQPQAVFVLAGFCGLLGGAAALDLAAASPASALLPLLSLLVAAATVVLDRLLAALVAAWGPPLVPSGQLLAAAALVLLLLAARATGALMLGLGAVSSGPGATVEVEMARFISARLREAAAMGAAASASDPTFVVPANAIDHPSMQLLASAALAAGHIQPLELARTLPYSGPPTGSVVYLLPLLDAEVLGLLQQLYPGGETATELDVAGARALFNRFTVAARDLQAAQTLQMVVRPAGASTGDTPAGAAGDATESAFASPLARPGTTSTSGAAAVGFDQPLAVAALDFAWGNAPPRELPFTAEWSGSLVVPESGTYRFAVDSAGAESTFTLLLDDVLVLDSSLGIREQQQVLAQGLHRLVLSFRSGNQPGDLRLRWQTPDGAEQVLQGPVLHSPGLPDQGLYSDYYDNESFAGAPIATHKDPILGLDPGLPLPYSVRWYGLLAAPRAGEYLLGADAGGMVQLVVDGQTLADNRASEFAGGDSEASSYTEGLIYLSAGWHPIEIRFTPQADGASAPADAGIAPGALRLLWQPPGADPGELGSRYLLPALGPIGTGDAPLPPAPPVVDPLLGDERFALTRATALWQPHLRLPPANLPPLPLERLWGAGDGCGSDATQFDAPHGLAFSPAGDRLYVADTGNRRVLVYSVDGALETTITSDLLQEPVDVAVTGDGTVLILDALAQGVFRLQGDGALAAIPLQTGFYRPRGFAVDALGNMAIADTGGGRLAVVAPDGALVGEFGGQGSLLGRGQPVDALAAEGALWAISAEDGRLWNLTADGSLTAVRPAGTVDGPHLAQLADGRILASDPLRSTFLLFSAAGEPLGQFAYLGELASPTGLAATRIGDGNIIAVSDTQACTLSVWRLAQ